MTLPAPPPVPETVQLKRATVKRASAAVGVLFGGLLVFAGGVAVGGFAMTEEVEVVSAAAQLVEPAPCAPSLVIAIQPDPAAEDVFYQMNGGEQGRAPSLDELVKAVESRFKDVQVASKDRYAVIVGFVCPEGQVDPANQDPGA